ncbi:MAG: Pyridoxamine 5'-phosphate oxidase-related FMN-binding protein [Nitrosopumilales archaeon]|uniref:Pyridoxamine 5'-phosphate oxidase-related FMN-binding protein n=1 Tax=uncultured bacterium W5-77b TaxID=1131000 RepID=H9BWG6_9BACT|nr:pyridoxamine 5'-phosphate oxidase-related FMN-binding protein [uncultured bacterium W5-77b]KAG2472209.1 MAG: Pyridoxamine 5'-phosphate oxidase-related FMN-binding protein [Nitrosopumilales archaeon]MCH8975941.1 PPOX class F420-dependent oxidoreductase [Nitrososphaerota archaeon]
MSQATITPEIAKLFQGKNFVSFSTLMKDGSPHVAPVWVDIDGNTILINTAVGRVKEKNVKRDNRVALSIFDHQNPYDMVAIRGKVIELTTDGADEHIDKLAKKYFGLDKYPYHSPDEKRIIVKIKPEKIYRMQPPPQK